MKDSYAFVFLMFSVLAGGCSLSTPELEVRSQFVSQPFSSTDIEIAKTVLEAIAKKYRLHLVSVLGPGVIRQYSERTTGYPPVITFYHETDPSRVAFFVPVTQSAAITHDLRSALEQRFGRCRVRIVFGSVFNPV